MQNPSSKTQWHRIHKLLGIVRNEALITSKTVNPNLTGFQNLSGLVSGFILSLLLICLPLLATAQTSQAELKPVIEQGDMRAIDKAIAGLSRTVKEGEEPQLDFELLYPLLFRPGFKKATYRRIIERLTNSQPEGIEKALFKVLNEIPSASEWKIVDFLVEQNYQPIQSYLLDMKNVKAYTEQDFLWVCVALAKLGTLESIQAATDCLQQPFTNNQMIHEILGVFKKLSTDISPDFKLIKQIVVPRFDNREIKKDYYDLLSKFQVKSEIPFLLDDFASELMASKKYRMPDAFHTLLKFEDMEVFEQIRQTIKTLYQAGKIDEAHYHFMNRRFDEELLGICVALVKLSTVESTQAATNCLQQPFTNNKIIHGILAEFKKLSTDIPLDFKLLKQIVVPHLDNREIKKDYYVLLSKFRVKSEIPFLLDDLASEISEWGASKSYAIPDVLLALLQFKDAEIFEQSRQTIEKLYKTGKIEKHRYDFMNSSLNRHLHKKSPSQEQKIVEDQPPEIDPKFLAEQQRINQINHTAIQLLQTELDLNQYIQVKSKYLIELEKLPEKYPMKKYPDSHSLTFLELSIGYIQLADFVRFYQKQPQQAITLYKKASQFANRPETLRTGMLITIPMSIYFNANLQLAIQYLIGMADTYQYALNQPGKAIEYYRPLLTKLERMPLNRIVPVSPIEIIPSQRIGFLQKRIDSGLFLWLNDWLNYEVNYLQTKQPFRGEISFLQLEAFISAWYFLHEVFADTGMTSLDPKLSRQLEKIDLQSPNLNQEEIKEIMTKILAFDPSHLTLLKTYQFVNWLETPDDILKYLAQHDPAGYWTAYLLGIVLHVEAQITETAQYDIEIDKEIFPALANHAIGKPLGIAAHQYFKKQGISWHQPDSRFSSPQKTLESYLQASKSQDIETFLICFSEQLRNQYKQLFAQLSPAEVQQIVDSDASLSVTDFTMTKPRNNLVIASTKQEFEGKIYTLFFQLRNDKGEWKIEHSWVNPEPIPKAPN